MPPSGDLSLYIHIPFCKKKCGYCHFYSIVNDASHRRLYLEALIQEIELRQELLKQKRIVSLYFGGGTPSLLEIAEIEKILSHLPSLHPGMEVTIEANPESALPSQMKELLSLGFNRISFGVQSFDDTLLRVLTRPHSAIQAKKAVLDAASSGFRNISIDLMMDLPHQTLSLFEASLQQAVSLPISHLSLYNLIFEPNTPFFRRKQFFLPSLPNEHESLRFLESTALLLSSGFNRYEISAWAKKDCFSVHNTGYWTGRDYLGLGPSSHSFISSMRWANPSNLFSYHTELMKGHLPEIKDPLDSTSRNKELLAIRLRYLVPFHLSDYSPAEETLQTIEHLIAEGLIKKEQEKIVLSQRGTLFYDTVAEMII